MLTLTLMMMFTDKGKYLMLFRVKVAAALLVVLVGIAEWRRRR